MNRRGAAVMRVMALAGVLAGNIVGCSVDLPTPVTPSAAPRPSPTATPPPAPTPFPPPGKVFLGVQTNLGPFDFSAVDAFASATGYHPPVMQFSQGWAHDTFRAEPFNAIADRGMLPIVSWEPWDFTNRLSDSGSSAQPAYRLAAIIDGKYDDYVRSWATGIAALPYPVVIRFAHEMNGFWYPWCEQSNGNKTGQYVAAWRHVHDIFTAAGARNVTWLWSPNVTYPGAQPLKALYPGDRYVDWVGLSGYYGTAGRTAYIGFANIFTNTLTELRSFTRKPIVIAETGATNATGRQAAWITDMFRQLRRHPEIIGVIWFEAKKEIDWRIARTPAAAAAFAAGAANPTYDVTWTFNGIPRRN